MVMISGFKYDIFISYTHDDNHSPTDALGWVDRFHVELESWLKYRRGMSNLTIWRDEALDGNTEFNLSIENKIKNSALFFVLNSQNYCKSEYCRKELEWFHRYHGGRPGGLIVGEHHRVFNILLNNITHRQWPQELGETSGFAMHDSPSSDKLGDFTYPDEQLYQKQLRRIVDAVEATLDEFSKFKPTLEERETQDHDVIIFMADVADSLQFFRKRIIADATAKKVQVLSNIPPPIESLQHAASVEKALAQADLSIHLFNQCPGQKILDQKTTTYPRTQWEIALKSDVRKLVWQPVDSVLTDGQDDIQRDFLEKIANGNRSSGQYEFVRAAQTDFLNVIQDKIELLRHPTGNGVSHRTFLVDTHQKDQRYAFKLAGILAENELDVDFNQESRDPNLSLTKFEQSIRQVQNLIILAGKVELAWLTGRIKKAIKIVSEQFEAEDTFALENIWVFLAPASGGRMKLPQFPPLIKINVLDNSHAETIDPQVISPLLQQANAGGPA